LPLHLNQMDSYSCMPPCSISDSFNLLSNDGHGDREIPLEHCRNAKEHPKALF